MKEKRGDIKHKLATASQGNMTICLAVRYALREASVESAHLGTTGKKAGEKANDSSGPSDNQ